MGVSTGLEERGQAMRNIHLVIIIALLALAVPAPTAHADGFVTICDNAHFLAALADGGAVTFACSGTITLTTEIVIAHDTTIDGGGHEVIISGNRVTQVFNVSPDIALILRHLTVSGGYAFGPIAGAGGGIYNDHGIVTIEDSVLMQSFAARGGGIYNDHGTVTILDSVFSNNGAYFDGGGIYNQDGIVTVINSSLTHNGAHYAGGGIYNHSGSLIVNRTTLADNGVGYGGGGIYNYQGTVIVSSSALLGNRANAGGGISNGGMLTVSNSTFFGNSVSGLDGGGGVFNYGTSTITNSTIAGNSAGGPNGAGIQSTRTMTIENTMIANNMVGYNCYGVVTDGGGNLSYPDATCPGINADPKLGPLQDNGGPTWTMALGPGSAAIDAGDDAICAADPVNNLDQRGMTRPQGAQCDIGALEQLRVWLPLMLAQGGSPTAPPC